MQRRVSPAARHLKFQIHKLTLILAFKSSESLQTLFSPFGIPSGFSRPRGKHDSQHCLFCDMIQSCHDWFPCCHDSEPKLSRICIHSEPLSILHPPFSSLLLSHRRCCLPSSVVCWWCFGLLTESEMNAKNVQAVADPCSTAVLRSQSQGRNFLLRKVFFEILKITENISMILFFFTL